MKKVFATLLLMAVTITTMAVPAKKGQWKTLRLNDGTEVRATLVGDEHGHFWKAEDGKTYTRQGDVWVAVDAQQIVAKAKARRAKVNAQRVQKRTFGHPSTIVGNKKAIIILANYKDTKFNSSHNNALYQKIANQENYSEGSFKGSMADYFKAQSRGKFTLQFDVVGPVTVSKNASYYGTNDSQDQDEHAAEMVIEAVNLAKAQVSDWTPYDWDGDGYVDQVYVIYAGKGEADGGAETTIWPHAYDLASAKAYGDGTGPVTVGTNLKVNGYACGPELDGQTGGIGGFGTMCHEYSHCLGYPDFYDIDYSDGQGMGPWDLMDQGSYNGDGFQPAGYTSYERWFAGWETPVELNAEDVNVHNMKSLQNDGESYIIYNDKNQNEYYLLENRQLEGWDASLPAAGLVILHCDYDVKVWEENGPNDDPNHQRMTVVPADGQYQSFSWQGSKYFDEEGIATDPFPQGSVVAFNKNFKTKDNIAKKAAQFFTKTSNGTYWMNGSVEAIKQNSDKTIDFNYVANFGGSSQGGSDPAAGEGDYEKVTSASQIVAGSEYVLYNAEYSCANGALSGRLLSAVEVMADGNTISGDGTVPMILGGNASGYSLQMDGKYLTTAKAKEMSLTNTESKVWTIDSTEDGYVLKAGNYGKIQFNYNNGNPRFLNYTSNQKPAVLYVKKASTGIQTMTTIATPRLGIYTLDGRYLGTDYTVLPHGLYIVNGKKMVK